ncbi:MAG: rRNA pseudouridine synthase, partial [Prevotellaceae bacterium]|nr:rRNA pseudouridine synthase [Prevotellaceae bacterium]
HSSTRETTRTVRKTAGSSATGRRLQRNEEKPIRKSHAGKTDNEKRAPRTSKPSDEKRAVRSWNTRDNSRSSRSAVPQKSTDTRRRQEEEFRPKARSVRAYDRPSDKKTDGPVSLTKEAARLKKAALSSSSDKTRLNKYIANSGICSRREADKYITAGVVSVNGEVVTEMGFQVKPGDDVRFNGERLKGETKVYIVMNKPKDCVTTTSDPHADKTVIDFIGDRCSQRVFPVGRLDKNTTGVLLLTNDGELTERLTHPSYNKKKIYDVFLNRKVRLTDLRKLLDGVELEDGIAKADHVEYVGDDKTEIGLEIHSGRNRVVRRMFEALGYHVQNLDRVYFAGLTKKKLRRGQWRFLSESEISALKMGAYE